MNSTTAASPRSGTGEVPFDATGRGRRSLAVAAKEHGWVLGTLAVVVFLALWQLLVTYHVINPLFAASPTQTASELGALGRGRDLWDALALSGEELGIGLAISFAVGVALGVVYGWYWPVRNALSPFVHGLNAMPQIAVVPVLILAFGIGIWSKVVIVILMTVTVFWLNTATAMQTVDYRFIRLARSFGANDQELFRTVALPHAVPYVLTGVRLAVGRGLIAVVVGELFASKGGIGHMLIAASDNFQIPQMYAALVIITAAGIFFNLGVSHIESRFAAWRG